MKIPVLPSAKRPYTTLSQARRDDRAWRRRAQKRIAADVAWVERHLRNEKVTAMIPPALGAREAPCE